MPVTDAQDWIDYYNGVEYPKRKMSADAIAENSIAFCTEDKEHWIMTPYDSRKPPYGFESLIDTYFRRGSGQGSGTGGTGALAVPNNHFFPNTAARDTFFTTEMPEGIPEGTYCVLTTPPPVLQQYRGGTWVDVTPIVQGQQGLPGTPGKDGDNGIGVPTGGTTGQMLTKASEMNFDTEWKDAPTTPGTGGLSQQQILALIDARLTGYIRADDIPILDALIDEMEGLNLFDP